MRNRAPVSAATVMLAAFTTVAIRNMPIAMKHAERSFLVSARTSAHRFAPCDEAIVVSLRRNDCENANPVRLERYCWAFSSKRQSGHCGVCASRFLLGEEVDVANYAGIVVSETGAHKFQKTAAGVFAVGQQLTGTVVVLPAWEFTTEMSREQSPG